MRTIFGIPTFCFPVRFHATCSYEGSTFEKAVKSYGIGGVLPK